MRKKKKKVYEKTGTFTITDKYTILNDPVEESRADYLRDAMNGFEPTYDEGDSLYWNRK